MVPFLSPNRAPLRKKGVLKIVPKKGASQDKNDKLFTGREAPGDGPRVRIFNNRNNSSDNNSSNYSNNCRNYCSSSSFVRSFCLTWCLKSLFGFDFKICLSCRAGDLTRPRQRPGEFCWQRIPALCLVLRCSDQCFVNLGPLGPVLIWISWCSGSL